MSNKIATDVPEWPKDVPDWTRLADHLYCHMEEAWNILGMPSLKFLGGIGDEIQTPNEPRRELRTCDNCHQNRLCEQYKDLWLCVTGATGCFKRRRSIGRRS